MSQHRDNMTGTPKDKKLGDHIYMADVGNLFLSISEDGSGFIAGFSDSWGEFLQKAEKKDGAKMYAFFNVNSLPPPSETLAHGSLLATDSQAMSQYVPFRLCEKEALQVPWPVQQLNSNITILPRLPQWSPFIHGLILCSLSYPWLTGSKKINICLD